MTAEADLIERRELLDGSAICRALSRIALEVVERNRGLADVALVGIRAGGAYLAERLHALLSSPGVDRGATPRSPALPLGSVDITLYRDDLLRGLDQPEVGPTDLPFSVDGKTILLVDDVLYTGRTVRAALDELMDFGRPRAVQLVVLVDRGHRELPIAADYVGLQVQTTRDESVRVMLRERGEVDRVVLRERKAPQAAP
jgi:pyrimidine operon attenuation protein/uracil phosphoribosyltransferase